MVVPLSAASITVFLMFVASAETETETEQPVLLHK